MNDKKEMPYWIGEYGEQMRRKTEGRIFVRTEEDVGRVVAIMVQMDQFEVEGYMGKEVVAVWPGIADARLVYTHKFEIRIDELRFRCWEAGIEVMVITGRNPGP